MARVIHYLYFGDYHTANEECSLDTHSTRRLPSQCTELVRTEEHITIVPKADTSKNNAKEDHELLATHFHVYRCANFLGIEPLKYDAAQSFIDLLSKPMSKECFAYALRMVYEHTASEDLILRAAFTELCAYNHRIVSQYPDLVSIMTQHELVAWKAACKAAKAYQKRHIDEQQAVALSAVRRGITACTICNKEFGVEDVRIRDNGVAIEVAMHCADEWCTGVYTFFV